MARITIIWERSGNLTVWRKVKSDISLEVDQGLAQSAEELFTFISKRFSGWGCSLFRLYLDHAGIDTRIERLPSLSRKLRNQLLTARLQQSTPDQTRTWTAEEITTNPQESGVYRFTSLPKQIGGWLSQWAQKNGIHLEGIYSLPIVLSEQLARKNELVLAVLPNSAYVFAFDEQSNFLYHNSVSCRGCQSPLEEADVESGVKRLQLFLEQEFEHNIDSLKLVTATPEELNRAITVRPKIHSSLLARADSLRLKFKRYRQRLFPVMVVLLLIVLNQSLPKYQERYLLKYQLSEARQARAQIERQLQSLRQANEQQLLLHSGLGLGLRGNNSSPLNMPIAHMIRVVSHFLGREIELDSIDCHLEIDPNRAHLTMTGRPVDTTVKLVEVLDRFEASLRASGWNISKFETEFLNTTNGGKVSRFARLGKNRKFRLHVEFLPLN